MQPSAWAANASLSSKAATSPKARPERSRARRTASTGPRPKNCGSTPVTALARIRASGSRPVARSPSSSTRRSAAAPSFSGEEFPAVTVPPAVRNTGFSLDSDSRDDVSRIVSSRARSTSGSGTTSASYAPSRQARAAF